MCRKTLPVWHQSIKRLELVAHLDVRVVEHPVLGAGAVPAGVLAEVLELLQRAAAEHLAQEEEQPVDLALVGRDLRPHGALVPAGAAVRQGRVHPRVGRAVVHGVAVGNDVVAQLPELGREVVRDGPPGGAALAARLALDGRDAPAQQALQRVVPRGPLRRPRERRLLRPVVEGGVLVVVVARLDAGAAAGGRAIVEAAAGGARRSSQMSRRRRGWSSGVSAGGVVDGSEGEGERVGHVAAAHPRRFPFHFCGAALARSLWSAFLLGVPDGWLWLFRVLRSGCRSGLLPGRSAGRSWAPVPRGPAELERPI
jgi:hypothetical protein